MIKGLAHICISATDLKVTEHFYCTALGFSKVFDFLRDDNVVGFYLEVSSGSYVEVFRAEAIDTEAKAAIRHFCIQTDDIELVARQLRQNGYTATEKKLGADQSWQIWTADPSGVRIEFHQYTENSSQITREDCVLK